MGESAVSTLMFTICSAVLFRISDEFDRLGHLEYALVTFGVLISNFSQSRQNDVTKTYKCIAVRIVAFSAASARGRVRRREHTQ